MSGPGPRWPPEPRLPGLDDCNREPETRPTTQSSRVARLGSGLLVLGGLALLAYPPVSLPIGCVIWGWDEILTARWLRRTDPHRVRGRVCSRFYMAWGLGRISLMATFMMFAIILLQEAVEGKSVGVGEPPPEFASCCLVTILGFLLSSVVASFGVISAIRHGVRVWVGREACLAWAEGTWPPQVVGIAGKTLNWTKVLVIVTLITVTMGG